MLTACAVVLVSERIDIMLAGCYNAVVGTLLFRNSIASVVYGRNMAPKSGSN
jgi:hypothetical protein